MSSETSLHEGMEKAFEPRIVQANTELENLAIRTASQLNKIAIMRAGLREASADDTVDGRTFYDFYDEELATVTRAFCELIEVHAS